MFSPSCERPWVASLWRGELSQDSQVRTNKLAKIRNQIRKKQIAKYLAAKNSLLNFGLCNFWDMSCHSHTMILKFEKSDANSHKIVRSDCRNQIAEIWLPIPLYQNMIAKNKSTKSDRQKQIAKLLNLRYGQTECVAPCTLTAPGDPQPDHVRDKKITNMITKAKKLWSTRKTKRTKKKIKYVQRQGNDNQRVMCVETTPLGWPSCSL